MQNFKNMTFFSILAIFMIFMIFCKKSKKSTKSKNFQKMSIFYIFPKITKFLIFYHFFQFSDILKKMLNFDISYFYSCLCFSSCLVLFLLKRLFLFCYDLLFLRDSFLNFVLFDVFFVDSSLFPNIREHFRV